MNKTAIMVVGALMSIAGSTHPALAETDVGVSINVGQPGFYGRIDIGDVYRPRVYYPQPVIVERGRYYNQEPVYLHVKPGHARQWKHHCREYNACDQRVYFVNDNWYNTVYVPQHRESRGYRNDRHDNGRGYNDRGHRNDRDHDEGRGHRNGRGHDK